MYDRSLPFVRDKRLVDANRTLFGDVDVLEMLTGVSGISISSSSAASLSESVDKDERGLEDDRARNADDGAGTLVLGCVDACDDGGR